MHFLLLEDIIANCVGDLFPGLEVKSAHTFRVTRDMDLDILEDKAEDLLKEVDRQVRHRRFGAAVRLEIAPELPSKIRRLLLAKLEIEDVDVYESRGPFGLACLFQIASLDRSELRDPPLTQRVPVAWSSRPEPFSAIRDGDILLHHPYDSFSPILELLGAAASDPNVLAIKLTLYRAGADAEAYSTRPPYRKLSVAPFTLRKRLGKLIDEQVRRAKGGGRGRIFAKLNALVDSDIIRSLYEASRAGVSIDLVVRGICCLRPGVPGVSENIRVRSMVGRFLEHERIFVFGSPGEDECFLSSADWMPRNLERRVEVFFPVTSEAVRRQIFEECIEPLGKPECATYEMAADGSYTKHQPVESNAVDPQDYALEVASSRRLRAVGHLEDGRARSLHS
jgi:polyphosphate kinase